MATNPRIDDLRKRIEKDPGSRLFAQLAEELRKDGELEEAIRVVRDGLQKHPNYPSARMTLGRALLDTGDWGAARTEFEMVLKSAADNILASRYLAECLENLGERAAAIARYKTTLAMAPGEKHVVARLSELEGTAPGAGKAPIAPARPEARPAAGLRPSSARPAADLMASVPVPAAAPAAAAVAPIPRPPIPLSTVEGEMELETSRPASGSAAAAPAAPPGTAAFAPIPLVDADEEFELERPYESPTTAIGSTRPSPAPAPPRPEAPAPASAEDQEFELEAPHEAPTVAWAASIRPLPVVEEAAPVRPAAVRLPPAMPQQLPLVPSTLTSPTLGELYFNQGFTDKAIEVYRELSAREPGNDRLSARLRELEKLQRSLTGGGPEPAASVTIAAPMVEPATVAPAVAAPVTTAPAKAAPPPADDPAADRREAIDRTIARLEGLLSAIRKG